MRRPRQLLRLHHGVVGTQAHDVGIHELGDAARSYRHGPGSYFACSECGGPASSFACTTEWSGRRLTTSGFMSSVTRRGRIAMGRDPTSPARNAEAPPAPSPTGPPWNDSASDQTS